MDNLWNLLLISFFATNSLDKTESVKVKLEETPLKTFDEIFGEGWWEKGEAEDLKRPAPTNFGQTEPNSIDQNPTFTESDHSNNVKNGEEQNEISSNEKHNIIDKFHATKDKYKKKGKFSTKEWHQIENKIAKDLKVTRKKIYKWKKEFGLSQFYENNERKNLVEKFDQMKAELKRAGFKKSYSNQLNETVAKELGLSFVTIYNWKSEFGQTKPNKHSHSKQKELMKRYYKIKDKNPKSSDEKIAKMLKIGRVTLYRWKRQFKRQQLHPNSVDGHSVEENVAANVQEFENSNL